MNIKNLQIDKLLLDKSFDLAIQAYTHINQFIPGELEGINKEDFIAIARKQIKNAKKYGIDIPTAQLRYVLIAFLFGEQFDIEIKIFNDIFKSWKLNKDENGEILINVAIEIFKAIDE